MIIKIAMPGEAIFEWVIKESPLSITPHHTNLLVVIYTQTTLLKDQQKRNEISLEEPRITQEHMLLGVSQDTHIHGQGFWKNDVHKGLPLSTYCVPGIGLNADNTWSHLIPTFPSVNDSDRYRWSCPSPHGSQWRGRVSDRPITSTAGVLERHPATLPLPIRDSSNWHLLNAKMFKRRRILAFFLWS